jgi:hypothetical protein
MSAIRRKRTFGALIGLGELDVRFHLRADVFITVRNSSLPARSRNSLDIARYSSKIREL